MTGGGTETVAIQREPVDEYMGSPTESSFYNVGADATLTPLELQNALQRMNNFSAESYTSRETTIEGAATISGTVTEDTMWLLNHHMGSPPTQSGSGPYDYTWSVEAGRCQSFRIFGGVDYLNGTVERVAKGAIIPQIDWECNVGESVTFNATVLYGDETRNTSITPGSQPSPTGPELMFHGGSLSIGGSDQKKMESASLSTSTGARFQRGFQRAPTDAVIGAAEHSLTPTKVIDDTDLLQLAYGNSTAPVKDSALSDADASLVFGSGGDTEAAFACSGAKPNTYSWENFGDATTDRLENTELYVNSVEPTLTTPTAEAR
ncbi:phage tail tube protein [Halobaculum sp. CBA1158]|uniref:phage tail tube protein n=1 Tax=Halobaculum sp. CBA1158 TaxID=2904243 RepID=UPI001F4316CC|nr:phage tail tube protein [Halobaculum sp. CBA1158]UIP00335.1 phage tail tube protein [Halobaculum sp. CBA1158]